MNNAKRALALLLCLVMVLSYVPFHAHAAGGATNTSMAVSATEVKEGDTFTVTVSYSDMTVASYSCALAFDTNLLECVSIEGCDEEDPEWLGLCKKKPVEGTSWSTPAEANGNGYVGFVYAGSKLADYWECVVFTATFVAKGTGNAVFTLTEDSSGAAGDEADAFKGVAATQTVTIKGNEPACEHTNTKIVSNNNGTHNVVCADETCGFVVTQNVTCSGTDDGDCTTAVTCACGYVVTAANATHTGGTATCTEKAKCSVCGKAYGSTLTHKDEEHDHICDNNCGVPQGEHKSNAQYACQDGICEYCNKPVAASANHTDGDDKDHNCDNCGAENIEGHTEETRKESVSEATCDTAATYVDVTFCSECGIELGRGTPYTEGTANGHTWGDPSYSWNLDYTACTAVRKCEKGCEETAQAKVTSVVTTTADCQTAEVVTYTADFTADWAVDQQEEVAGDINPDNHVNTHIEAEWTRGENNTHFRWRVCDACKQNVAKENVAECMDPDTDGDHNCDFCGRENINDHRGGTGSCQAPATCEECGKSYGELDPEFHVGEVMVSYYSTTEHKITFSCCPDVALIQEHSAEGENESCCDVCGAVLVMVMDITNPMKTENLWAEAGKDFVYGLNSVDNSVVAMAQVGNQVTSALARKGESGVLTIPNITAPAQVLLVPAYIGRVNLNGGVPSNEEAMAGYEAMGLEITDTYHETVIAFGSTMAYLESDYTREGFIFRGYKVNGVEYALEQQFAVSSDGFVIDLIWEPLHTHEWILTEYKWESSENVADYSCTAYAVCSCGETTSVVGTTSVAKTDEAWCYMPAGYCWTAEFDVAWAETQTLTGRHGAERDPDRHGITTNLQKIDEHTHQAFCYYCQNYLGEPEPHDTKNVNFAGNCLSPANYTCSCGYNYAGTTQPDVHAAGSTIYYKDITEEQHTAYHPCCGDPIETVNHDYTTGTSEHTCVCGAVEKFTITFADTGDSTYAPITLPYGADVAPQADPEKTGYTFVGWDIAIPSTMPAENLTITAQWQVNVYTLTVNVLVTDEKVELTVPYGANMLEVLAQASADKKIPAIGDRIRVNDEWANGEKLVFRYSYQDENGEWIFGLDGLTMPAMDFSVDQDYNTYGWIFSYDSDDNYQGAEYVDEDVYLHEGWHYIEEDYDDVEGGAWYYFAEGATEWEGYYFRAEGLTRVPYPAENINGWEYAPDAEALAYAESKGETFIDATEAWFNFDEDGKFVQDSGIIEFQGATRFLMGGMLDWHPGVVIEEDVTYYFIGDATIGGNIAAEGDTYITYNNGVESFKTGDVYNFVDGQLSGAHGIVDGKYYENSRLMMGNGLTKVGENFIYVRSSGAVVIGASYWVPANELNIAEGLYTFDENGYMVNPVSTEKDGIYYENGKLYYYVDGKIAYNKGLVVISAVWHSGEGDVYLENQTVYVKSDGTLATGYYYVTNVDNYTGDYNIASGTKLQFSLDGQLLMMNGIVWGKYYVNGVLAYNAGVVEIEPGKYIYVRSNGAVVMDRSYWITNVGDSGVVAKQYTFDANGIMQNPEFVADQLNGIVDGYYYVDGKIAYGAGLLKLSDENGEFFIYVRSNGQLATGIYWPTTTNGYDFSGRYDFGTDGKLYT